MQLQTEVMSYGGGSTASVPGVVPRAKSASTTGTTKPAARHDCGCGGADPQACRCHDKAAGESDGKGMSTANKPDFSRMTGAEKLAYNKAERDRIFGG